MKILQLSNRVPWPLNEGGTIGIYNFTKAFAQQGHEVYLYCLDGLKHHTPIAEAKAALSPYAELLIHPIDTDVKWEDAFRNLWSKESYNIQRFKNESFKEALIELLKKERFDVIQLEGSYVGPYVDVIKQFHKGLLSLRMHNAEFEIWERLAQNQNNPIVKQYLNLLARRLRRYEQELLKKVDCVVAVSPDDLEKFKSLYPALTGMVIPAGIDIDKWAYFPSRRFEKCYHLGSLEWHANREAVDYFLAQLWPKIKSQQPQIEFHLAGKGLNAMQYPQANIVLHQKVEDAYSFVQGLDVCVVPLLSGSGIRLKILEAMSAGKLVISSRVGAQGIDAENGIHICLADDWQEWQQWIIQMEKDPASLQKICESARALIESQYSIQAVTRKLTDYYSSLSQAINAK